MEAIHTSTPISSSSPSQTVAEKDVSAEPSVTVPSSRRRLYIWLAVGFIAIAAIAFGLGLGLHFGLQKHAGPMPSTFSKPSTQQSNSEPNQISGPAIDSNFPDPCYIKTDKYYAFATNRFKAEQPNGQINVQIATSDDFKNWTLLEHQDALPDPGAWAAGFHIWAPDVVQLDNGSFVLYYSAATRKDPRRLCIGSATSKNVSGPYKPAETALVCPFDQGGAIDAEGFKDTDGTRYVIYKVDGNNLNVPNRRPNPTPLMLQQVAADGISLVGSPTQLLDRTDADGPLIEAPAMARYNGTDGKPPLYVLFFSSNVFSTPNYDVSYATASSVKGPFTRSGGSLLKTGDSEGKLIGPGGLDCGESSTQVVFHSIRPPIPPGGEPLTRTMWTGNLSISGDKISL